jgi:DNA invertase Pin-like site-specific DNA recombinase
MPGRPPRARQKWLITSFITRSPAARSGWVPRTDRPGLGRELSHLRPGDTLVVWRLDRLGRSLGHLIDAIKDLQGWAIHFKSLQEQLDTGTSGGKLVFHVFGALAEFERDLVRERTLAGLAAARARGGWAVDLGP